MQLRPAIFLDRDDTIIANREVTADTACPGDLLDPKLVRFLPRALDAMKLLGAIGMPLVVVTNQGGIAQGFGTHADVEAVNDRLRQLLQEVSVELAAVYYSPNREIKGDRVGPHGPDVRYTTSHSWRKPQPGMLLAAASELGLDLSQSWMVGDGERDVEAGIAAGLDASRCIQIGKDVPDLFSAAQQIMTSCGQRLP